MMVNFSCCHYPSLRWGHPSVVTEIGEFYSNQVCLIVIWTETIFWSVYSSLCAIGSIDKVLPDRNCSRKASLSFIFQSTLKIEKSKIDRSNLCEIQPDIILLSSAESICTIWIMETWQWSRNMFEQMQLSFDFRC